MMKWRIGRVWTLRPVVRHTVSNVRVARHRRHIADGLCAKRSGPYIKLVFRFLRGEVHPGALSYPCSQNLKLEASKSLDSLPLFQAFSIAR